MGPGIFHPTVSLEPCVKVLFMVVLPDPGRSSPSGISAAAWTVAEPKGVPVSPTLSPGATAEQKLCIEP